MASGIRCARATTLTLIRHGESQANLDRCFGGHSPSPLTALGLQQAEQTAAHFAAQESSQQTQRIYTSDLMRARQTAEPIAKTLGLELLSEPGLRERSVGELDGKTFLYAQEEAPELWQGLIGQDPSWCPPGGESVQEAYDRMRDCLETLLTRHVGEHVIAVTHAIAIHLGINALLGVGSPAAMGIYFSVANSSRSTFVIGPKRTQVTGINQVNHLAALDHKPG